MDEAGVPEQAPGEAILRASNSDPKSQPWLAICLVGILLLLLFVDVSLYASTQPDLGDGHIQQPSWSLVGDLGAASAGALGILALKPVRCQAAWRPILISVLVVSCITISLAVWLVEGVPLPGYLDHAPGRQATQQAWQALLKGIPGGTCVKVTHDSAGPMPTPFWRCAYRGSGMRPVVLYDNVANGLPDYGFSFNRPSGACVKELSPHWWAQVTISKVGSGLLQWDLGDAVVCPASYQYLPI